MKWAACLILAVLALPIVAEGLYRRTVQSRVEAIETRVRADHPEVDQVWFLRFGQDVWKPRASLWTDLTARADRPLENAPLVVIFADRDADWVASYVWQPTRLRFNPR